MIDGGLSGERMSKMIICDRNVGFEACAVIINLYKLFISHFLKVNSSQSSRQGEKAS